MIASWDGKPGDRESEMVCSVRQMDSSSRRNLLNLFTYRLKN